jgi:ubiquinol-cytochrome c reductase cytochrome c1 subunit
MVRIIAGLTGLFFAGWLIVSAIMGTFAVAPVISKHGSFVEPAAEKKFHKYPRDAGFSFAGPVGKFDQAQLQRGLQVYKEVCAACHGMRLLAFRDLEHIGYTEGQVKTIASEWPVQVPSINPDTGEAATRKAVPADRFPSPFPNDVAARAANNNAIPPDLTLMTKARHDGPNYVYSLLTGYQEPSPELLKEFPSAAPGPGLHHNPYFHSLNIAMTQPLGVEGQVTYGEGAPKATVDQMAKDVTAFLAWASEPKAENRKQAGLAAMLFLLIFAVLTWFSYQQVWADKKRK